MTTETPILYSRLSQKGKGIFNDLKKWSITKNKTIRVSRAQYDELLKAIPEHQRIAYYQDKIPFNGKEIVRI